MDAETDIFYPKLHQTLHISLAQSCTTSLLRRYSDLKKGEDDLVAFNDDGKSSEWKIKIVFSYQCKIYINDVQ